MSIQSDQTDSGSTIHVAQALHGYQRGHELLATSRRLSRDGERALLGLSDLSGSAARTRGFESYIAGYPVPGERLYAFARTWLATGGARPGSVWTHTLLLTPEQLAMQGVANLARWFRRPLTPEQASDYSTPLEINEGDIAERPLEPTPSQSTKHRIQISDLFEASTVTIARNARSSCQPRPRVSTRSLYSILGRSSGLSFASASRFAPDLYPSVRSLGTRSICKSSRMIAQLRSRDPRLTRRMSSLRDPALNQARPPGPMTFANVTTAWGS